MRVLKIVLFTFLSLSSFCFAIECVVQPSDSLSELVIDLTPVENKIIPESCNNLKFNQEHVAARKRDLDELDKKESGMGTSDEFSKMYNHYTEQAKLLEDVFITCQKDLHNICYSKNKKSISYNHLSDLFENLKKDPLLRSSNPGANCFERAYVISKIFADKGYDVKITVMNAPLIMGRNPVDKSQFHKYPVHAVVTIDVETKANQIEKFVIDPEFEDQIISFDEYAKQTTGQKCRPAAEIEKNYSDIACSFESHEPIRPVFPTGSELHTEDILKVKQIDICGWAFNETSLERLQHPSDDPSLKWTGSTNDFFKSAYDKMRLYEKDSERLKFLDSILSAL